MIKHLIISGGDLSVFAMLGALDVLIDKYDENPLKENTEEEDRYGDTQKEVKAQIDSGKLSLESLVYIQSTIF